MKDCIKNSRFGLASLAVAALLIALTCCTKVDDKVGLDLIPNNQTMSIGFDTISSGINTYATLTDSMVASGLITVYMGKTESTDFGKTTASAVMQYLPLYRSDSVSTGINSQVDSLWLLFSGSILDVGNMKKTQSFYVYDVIKPLYSDSLYYTGFPYEQYINPQPLFSFSYKGNAEATISDTLKLKIENQALASEYFDKLMNLDEDCYESDSLFLANMNGFYIAPTDESPENGTLLQVNLDDGDSYFLLFGHNYDPELPAVVLDTLARYYTFYADNSYAKSVSVACVRHDYSGTPIEQVIKPVGDSDYGNPLATTYIQGLVGVTTTLEFTDDMRNQLLALVPEGKEMFVNQAMLYIWLQNQGVDEFDAAPSRVGSYTRYGTLNNIVDYNYYYEKNANSSSSSSYSLPYDGYLNRSNGYYPLNITSYIQRLLNDGDTQRRVTLGQEAYSIYLPAQVVLNGSAAADLPPKMSVTYTLVDKNLK